MTEETPSGLHVDSDWKAEAQREKVRLADAEKKAEEKAEARKMPEANFRGLLGILASQALMGLGTMQDPKSQGVMVDLEGAKFAIDLLAVIEEKTKGNLEPEESAELTELLRELQARFVQIAELVAKQVETGGMAPAAKPESATGIIDPTA